MDNHLTDKDIYHLFQRDPLGRKVFEEMCSLYYDVSCFEADNMYQTAYNEGRRSIISELMFRMSRAELNYDGEPENL